MTIITALELRQKLEQIIDLIEQTGEEVIVTYRGAKKIKISAFTNQYKAKSKVQFLKESLESDNYNNYLKRVKKNRENLWELDENNPRQEKLNIRKSKAAKYDK